MKITINTKTLCEALARACRCLPLVTADQRLNNVYLQAAKDSLTVLTNGGEIAIITVLHTDADNALSVTEEGYSAVPAKKFLEVLQRIEAGTVSLKADGRTLLVKYDTGHSELPDLNSNDMPATVITLGDDAKEFTISAETLKDAIDKTIYACTDDSLRPALNGIMNDIGPDGLTLVASDARCLAIMKVPGCTAPAKKQMDIHEKAMRIVASIIKDIKDDELSVSYRYNESDVLITIGETIVSTKPIKAKFPDISKVQQTDNIQTMKIEREELLATLKRISVCASKSSKCVVFHLIPDVIGARLEVTGQDIGFNLSAKEELSIDYSGEELSIAFNTNTLQEILSNIDADNVRLVFNGPKKPTFITPEEQKEDRTITHILMPIMVS